MILSHPTRAEHQYMNISGRKSLDDRRLQSRHRGLIASTMVMVCHGGIPSIPKMPRFLALFIVQTNFCDCQRF